MKRKKKKMEKIENAIHSKEPKLREFKKESLAISRIMTKDQAKAALKLVKS